jgi:glycosyltransferase involved in cell wall biosynthesis
MTFAHHPSVRWTPRVSLIVPTGNRRILLQRCIRQAFWQTCAEPFELVIVDGGDRAFDPSKDLPTNITETMAVRYVRAASTTTVGQRRNLAIENARGELIAHFDDDDFYHRDYLDQLLQWWDAHQPIDLGGFSQFWHYDFFRKRGWKTNLWESGHPYGATFLYRKTTWKAVGGFQSLQKGEDQEFFQAVQRSGDRIASSARPDLFVYMRHTLNVTGAIDPIFHEGWTKAARDVLGASCGFYDDLAELVNVAPPAAAGVQFHLPQNLRTFGGQGTP